jgi:hypothetical protein
VEPVAVTGHATKGPDVMTTTTDTPAPAVGRYGRRAPSRKPALRLAQLLSGVIPAHPERVDFGAAITDWQLLGNDAAGDCASVAWANERHAVTSALTTASYPTQDMVWTVYRSQNPGFAPGHGPHGYGSDDDAGMMMQELQNYLHTTGGADGVKSVAFASVDVGDREQIEASIAIFGGVSWGVTVTKANEQEFSARQGWDYVPGSPAVGGHAIYGCGYGDTQERFITWATETAFTDAFRTHQADEAWVTIWPEHLGTRAFQQGVDLAALKAAYLAITGRVLDVPDVPTADPDTALWSATSHFRASHHRNADNTATAKALTTWGQAKGFR